MQLTANNEAFSELIFVGGQELSRGIGFFQWLNYLSKGVGALPIQWPMVKISQFWCHDYYKITIVHPRKEIFLYFRNNKFQKCICKISDNIAFNC